jgi:hypothetical protein
MEEKRDTVGKLATDLLQKEAPTRDPIELQREMQKTYEDQVLEAINRGIKQYPGDFYVVVETKKERLLENVLRNYFFPRSTCPTPIYDQTVYRYHAQEQAIEFLWVVPSRDTCVLMRENFLSIVDDEKPLLQFVLMFEDGTLLRYAKKLNGEEVDSPLIIA